MYIFGCLARWLTLCLAQLLRTDDSLLMFHNAIIHARAHLYALLTHVDGVISVLMSSQDDIYFCLISDSFMYCAYIHYCVPSAMEAPHQRMGCGVMSAVWLCCWELCELEFFPSSSHRWVITSFIVLVFCFFLFLSPQFVSSGVLRCCYYPF